LDALEEGLETAHAAHADLRELAGPRGQRESRARRPRRGTVLHERRVATEDVEYWCNRLLAPGARLFPR